MVGLVVLALAFAAGCGDGADTRATPAARIAAAVGRTARGTVLIASSSTVVAGHDRFELVSLYGQQDFEAHRSRVSVYLRLSELDPEVQDVYLDGIRIGSTSYESIWGLDLPPGKTWVRIRPTDLRAVGSVQTLSAPDPSNGLKLLKHVVRVERAGTAEVRGVPATRYTMRVDVSSLLLGPAGGARAVDPGIVTMRSPKPTWGPGTVWLDTQGRVRRARFRIPVPASGVKAHVLAEVNYHGFGAKVSISRPASGEIASFADALDQLRSFFSPGQGVAPIDPSA